MCRMGFGWRVEGGRVVFFILVWFVLLVRDIVFIVWFRGLSVEFLVWFLGFM